MEKKITHKLIFELSAKLFITTEALQAEGFHL